MRSSTSTKLVRVLSVPTLTTSGLSWRAACSVTRAASSSARCSTRRSSGVNPLLEVVVVNGRKILNCANVNYSYGSLQLVFEDAFLQLDLGARRIESALLLGCGGGCVVRLLADQHAPGASITAVELDPVVLDLARQHFELDRVPGTSLVQADAADYVSADHEQRFDLVVVDVFVDDEIPPACQTPAFLRKTARLLAPGGMLLYNRLYHTPERRSESDLFAQVFGSTLGATRGLEVRTNLILVHERTIDPREKSDREKRSDERGPAG